MTKAAMLRTKMMMIMMMKATTTTTTTITDRLAWICDNDTELENPE